MKIYLKADLYYSIISPITKLKIMFASFKNRMKNIDGSKSIQCSK